MNKICILWHNKYMDEIKQIEKTTQELNDAERQILDEHTKKTAQQLNHYINLKRQKLYLKKKVRQNEEMQIKEELKNNSLHYGR